MRCITLKKEKAKIEVVFIPTEGDVVEKVIDMLELYLSRLFMKHGLICKTDLRELLRQHVKI